MIPYVPRLTLEWLAEQPDDAYRRLQGTVVFADLSGFTAMSERLAALGREGAERLAEVIDTTFASLLTGVYAEGGQLIAFGGDAMLLLFSGARPCRARCPRRRALRHSLRSIGRHETPRGTVQLRVSIGVHTGEIAALLVGSSHRQLLLAGSGISAVVDAEHTANAGQIIVTDAVAQKLPSRCIGAAAGNGWRLARAPAGARSVRNRLTAAASALNWLDTHSQRRFASMYCRPPVSPSIASSPWGSCMSVEPMQSLPMAWPMRPTRSQLW